MKKNNLLKSYLQRNERIHRLFFFIFLSLMISGCATGLKNEVRALEKNIQQNQQTLSAAKGWLNANSDVYDGKNCVAPARGDNPKFSCKTKEEARQSGLALCAASYKGCSVVVKSLGNQLNGWDEKFLASEACEQLLAEYTGEPRSSVHTVVDGIHEYAKDRCENGGFFGKVFGCYGAFVGEVVKLSQFLSCTNTKTQECFDNYDNWVYGPSRRKEKCKENIVAIHSAEQSIYYNSSALRQKKSTFMWKLFGDH